VNFTARDFDLLEALTRRIRVAAVFQIVALWWTNARVRTTARARLKELAAAGWLELHRINARPLPTTVVPLIVWQPGEDDQHAEQAAATIRERRNIAAEPIEVCVASAKAANLFGSSARGLPSFERRDHDLRLAAVYCHYRKTHPDLARSWVGDHARLPNQELPTNPDAVLLDARRRITRVIESAGEWNASQINAFHEFCLANDLPYELW
jgi:hypothetical protein